MARVCVIAGVAAAALLTQPVLAQQQNPTRPLPAEAGSAQELSERDQEFAKEAAEGGLKEVQLGELAQQQAKSPEVVDFGRRMVQDHGKANDRLRQIAQQKGVELPQELPQDARQQLQELEQLSGEPFDQAYMEVMVEDHQEDVEAFEQQAQSGQDSDLKSFAEETLPILREHLQLAQKLQSEVGRGGG